MIDAELYPLTLSQEAIYLDQLILGDNPKYNMGAFGFINGAIDPVLFEKALKICVSFHSAMNIKIVKDGDEIKQTFAEIDEFPFEYTDYSKEANALEKTAKEIVGHNRIPVDTFSFPLFFNKLYKIQDEAFVWYPGFYHIQNDAFGHGVLTEGLISIYNALLNETELPDIPKTRYQDQIEDDLKYLESEKYKQDISYWMEEFDKIPDPLPFTLKRFAQKEFSTGSEHIVLNLNRICYNSMQQLAESIKASDFHILLAITFTILYKMYKRDEIVIGLPILNRSNKKFRGTVGMFTSMMPLKIAINGDMTITEVIENIKMKLRRNYRYQRLPLGHLVHNLRDSHPEVNTLFDVVLIYNNSEYSGRFGDASVRINTLDTGEHAESLSILVEDMRDGEDVKVNMDFNKQVFEKAERDQFVKSFENILIDVLFNPSKKLDELVMVNNEDLEKGLHVFNKPETPVSYTYKTVIDALNEVLRDDNDSVAIIHGEEEYTYKEINKLSNAIGAYLKNELKIQKEDIIGLSSKRTPLLFAAIIGIMKAGGVYMPLYHEFPKQRIDGMLENAGCKIVLTDNTRSDFDDEITLVALADIVNYNKAAEFPKVTEQDAAYIIYTSGSTGTPKGVVIEHKGIVNFIYRQQKTKIILKEDRVLQFANISFDASMVEFFPTMVYGASLVIVPDEIRTDIPSFVDYLETKGVSQAILTPSYLKLIPIEALKKLRVLLSVAEEADAMLLNELSKDIIVINEYGPTEITIVCCNYTVPPNAALSRVPIGKPLPNVTMYILDEAMNILPPFVTGEIYVGGRGVARGYINNPELTKQVFIPNPFNEKEKLYKTGDQGIWLENGDIVYMGRADAQVKIHGYRIELEEIANQAKQMDEVSVAFAVLGDSGEEIYLYTLLEREITKKKITEFLKSVLPVYMIPSRFFVIETIPTSSSAKVDKNALKHVVTEELIGDEEQTEAATETEEKVKSIFLEILHRDSIGVEDNFFEYGGNSLNAIRIIGRISEAFQVDIALRYFLEQPTIRHIALAIDALNTNDNLDTENMQTIEI